MLPEPSHIDPERTLFKQLSTGNEEAYTKLFHLFTPRLFPYILKITKDQDLAKELLQEVFIKLWVHRADLADIEQPASWLFRVAANTCLAHLRTQASRYRILRSVVDKEEGISNDTLEYAETKDMGRVIRNAVNALPPKRQQIYRLSREEGFSHQQIADKLKISLQTVKNQMGIALKSIQDFMHKGFGLFFTLLIILGVF
ncbi:MAG: RNA polymerase sigma-70 factor [Bacteroidota bacterium]